VLQAQLFSSAKKHPSVVHAVITSVQKLVECACVCVLGLQYVNWCAGGDKDSFFTNSYCQQLYQNHIKTFVNRWADPPLLSRCPFLHPEGHAQHRWHAAV
jgi:hypothetical protein